jgi:predicted RNase H-like HicB family nuclease
MTKKLDYLIKLTYDKEYKGYVADVLNLYGCMSEGKTKKEAVDNAQKAISAYMGVVSKNLEKDAELETRSIATSFPAFNV